jgi:hypothetical protein
VDGRDGVESNARVTGALGGVLLVAFAIEGVTVPAVRQLLTLHVFIGLFVIPVATVKLGTTGYRFARYYRGAAAYREKGPPHPILRVAGPFVVLSTITLLGTGVALLVIGPSGSDTWRTIHQVSFFVWFAFMTIHVLGHVLETWRLTRDEALARPAVPRRGVRVSVVAASIVVGLVLGVASTGWKSDWTNSPRRHPTVAQSIVPPPAH